LENSEFEKKISYSFKNKRLLEEALTHSSCNITGTDGGRFDNERLEFVGDAILDAVIGAELFERMPGAQEGTLTKLRAKIVCEDGNAEVAFKLSVSDFLRMGKGEEKTGGRERKSISSDALEAVIGAIYEDGGYDAAKDFILRVFAEPVGEAVAGGSFGDFKSELQETLQSELKDEAHIEYHIIKETGPEHDKTFFARVMLNGKEIGRGSGKTKKQAEQDAARAALGKGL
jgi:ribonuclease-3